MKYDTSEWYMKRMICQHDLISEYSNIVEDIWRAIGGQILSIHSNDADIVLLRLREQIVECNMLDTMWEEVCNIPVFPICYGLVF